VKDHVSRNGSSYSLHSPGRARHRRRGSASVKANVIWNRPGAGEDAAQVPENRDEKLVPPPSSR
jgi:hypothetical protein